MNISPINAESECEPLCRSYVCAVFDVLSLRIQGEAGPRPVPLLWAIGILSDHLPHYLGAWHMRGPEDSWPAVADDLRDRGIERLRIVFAPDPVETQAALAAHYRGVTVVPAAASIDDSLIDPALSGHRPYIERALNVAGPLNLRLKRAVARHGPFAAASAAAALVRGSADRYIYANWPAHPEPPMRAMRETTSWTMTATGG